MKKSTVTFEQIYKIVQQIPEGRVATYGQIAEIAGNKRWARIVGYALHDNPDQELTPCHRVVNREGRMAPAFAFGGEDEQARLLRKEGVEVKDGIVDLSKYQWMYRVC